MSADLDRAASMVSGLPHSDAADVVADADADARSVKDSEPAADTRPSARLKSVLGVDFYCNY